MHFTEKETRTVEVKELLSFNEMSINREYNDLFTAINEFMQLQPLGQLIDELSATLNHYLEQDDLTENEAADRAFQFHQVFIFFARLYDVHTRLEYLQDNNDTYKDLLKKGVKQLDKTTRFTPYVMPCFSK